MATSRLLILDGMSVTIPPGTRTLGAEAFGVTEKGAAHPEMLDHLARALAGVDEVFVACPPSRRATWSTVLKASKTLRLCRQMLLARSSPIRVVHSMLCLHWPSRRKVCRLAIITRSAIRQPKDSESNCSTPVVSASPAPLTMLPKDGDAVSNP